jgi:hypothetical protein
VNTDARIWEEDAYRMPSHLQGNMREDALCWNLQFWRILSKISTVETVIPASNIIVAILFLVFHVLGNRGI